MASSQNGASRGGGEGAGDEDKSSSPDVSGLASKDSASLDV